MTTTTTISIRIPEGAEAGDTLQFEAQGQLLDLLVPAGSVPGDLLEIQVGSISNNENGDERDENDDITIIDMGKGKCLELFSQLPGDVAHIPESDDDNDEATDGTFALPWRCGIELAENWEEIESLLLEKGIHSRRRIIELGSGLGLVGLSFVTYFSNDSKMVDASQENRILAADNATIVLTDLPAAMSLLDFNVNHHQPSLPSPPTLSTRSLRWTLERPDNDPFTNEPPFDFLLGSDILYNTEYIPHLTATIKRLLNPTRGVVVLAVRWRKPDLERVFFQDSGLEWQLLQPNGKNYCPLSWEDFGDPSNESSNRYFHQTLISVNGKPQSIADITEDQAKDLPPEEFQAWEHSFIQLYLGTPMKETTAD